MSEKSLSERIVALRPVVILIGDEFFCNFAGVFSGDTMYLRAGEVADEEVAHNWRVNHIDCHHMALHVHFCAGRGDESGLVGVVVVDVDDGVEAALDEVSEEELHVSGFVASECESGGVVALDEDARDGFDIGIHRLGDCGSESCGFFEWRAESCQFDAREFGDSVEDCLVIHGAGLLTVIFVIWMTDCDRVDLPLTPS